MIKCVVINRIYKTHITAKGFSMSLVNILHKNVNLAKKAKSDFYAAWYVDSAGYIPIQTVDGKYAY